MKPKINLVGWLVFLILGTGFCWIFFVLVKHKWEWHLVKPYMNNLWSGWGYTVGISLVALVLSILVGLFLTMGQLSRFKPAQLLTRIYIEFFRGTPLLVSILVFYYLIANSLGWDERISVSIAILAMFGGAYFSEIFRAGVESIPQSQWLSARAIGFTPVQTYRHVVVPQAIRRVMPASAGQMANLIKDSSLLYLISVPEFFMQAKQTQSNSLTAFESFLPLTIGYLALTIPISLYSRYLEKRYGFDQ